jgi:hypothetical protein
MRSLNKLNELEKQFLKEKNLKAAHVFDATKILSAKEWKSQIKKTECEVAFCATSCTKDTDHRLKTKAGHCALCNPRNLYHQRSYRKPGDIYVVYSKELGFCKIGRSEDVGSGLQRVTKLNRDAYGNAKDWLLKYYAHVPSALCGWAENEILNLLSSYKVHDLHYQRGSKFETAREIVNCAPSHAVRVAKKVIKHCERLANEK